MNWKILETENAKTARFEMPQKAKMTPKYKKNDAFKLFFRERIKASDCIRMR
jgi:hypothetical protein